jgi:peptidoglycan LD-endopeptidase LytH
VLVSGLDAATKRRPVRDPLQVAPSDILDARVRAEIATAETILNDPLAENLFDSPYLVSAIYYRDGFLASYPTDRADGDPSRRILGHLARVLSPEARGRYLQKVREYCEQNEPVAVPPLFLTPVDCELPRRSRRTHPNAIDLFVREGSPVRSASYGVVLLAEGGWDKDDPLSTSSRGGGNSAIVFDARSGRLFRYCHLDKVGVKAGDPVTAGQVIGTVGHTGLNASRQGHGRHLHFEINAFDGRSMRPFDSAQLREFLRSAVSRIPTDGTRAGVLP